METYAGRYAIEHTPLVACFAAAWLTTRKRSDGGLHRFVIGATRTMQQDVTFGLRQLVDVAVKALSPGINDPTTAQDAIFHTAAVLSELLRHDPPSAVTLDGSRRVLLTQQPSHRELIQVAFDETRRAGATQPTVCLYLLTTLESLIESLRAAGLGERTTELRRQASLVAAGCGRPEVLADDIQIVHSTYDDKFE